jgi:hypothetical protein
MTVIASGTRTRAAPWGRRLLSTLSALLILNAAWLFFAVGSPAVVEADTGVALSELEAAYPAVAAELATRGRTIALLLGGLAALALVVSIGGLREGATWARHALWAFAAALVAVGANAFGGGNVAVGSFYLTLSVVAAGGLVLATRESHAARL